MKKLAVILFCIIMAVCAAVSVTACGGDSKSYTVYAPDGAPALSLVSLCGDDGEFGVKIVKSDTIDGYVTGGTPKADFALLPVNTAVQALGSGESYQLLGTVTHGNLFLVKKADGVQITTQNLTELVGKTVGVINLANIPGLTLKLILKDNGVEFNELKDGAAAVADKVNLLNIKPANVDSTNSQCDYFVVPEPAATTRINISGGTLSVAASLQTLYGEGGYPQAVAVVKKSVAADKSAVDKFIASFAASKNMLTASDFSAESIVEAVRSKTVDDLSPTFTAANLTAAVIVNCGINFVPSSDCKQDVKSFINKLNGVSANSWGEPAEAFFY